MVRLPSKTYLSRRCDTGLTLIEVLIALAIVGIAIMAVLKAVSQNIRATHHVQQKTIALWVGQSVLNETRAGVLAVDHSSASHASTTMLGQEWFWQLQAEDTPNPHIKKLRVQVFANEAERDRESSVLTLESYVYDQS